MTDRKKPGVAFWASVVVAVVLLGYPLSFGPACWVAAPIAPLRSSLEFVYHPLALVWGHGPEPMKRIFRWYPNALTGNHVRVSVLLGPGEVRLLITDW